MRWGVAATIGIFLWGAAVASAQEATVRLKDGTVLKGTRIEKQEGRWVLESPALGTVSLREEDVQLIEYAAAPQASTPAPSSPAGATVVTATQASLGAPGPAGIDKAAYEKVVMSDAASMAALMKMVQEPEITDMLSDPEFRKKVQNFDVAGLQQDPRFLKFIERSDVQEIAQRASSGASQGNDL